MAERKLTDKQEAFVAAYLETGNATESYRRAYDAGRMKPGTVSGNAYALLKDKRIAGKLEEIRSLTTNAAVLDRAGVLSVITEIALADASAFSEIQIRNCRHCWGKEHRYHWVNESEHAYKVAAIVEADARALARWEDDRAEGRRSKQPRPTPLPDDSGGYGFDVRGTPNPECPECHGDGIEHVRFKDTRNLSGGARRLFAGVKRTKDGFEIKTRDQDKMLDILARHHKLVGPDTAPPPAGPSVNINAQGGNVVVIPSDPQAASQAYQEMMKG
jgi:phage terminase small subunit